MYDSGRGGCRRSLPFFTPVKMKRALISFIVLLLLPLPIRAGEADFNAAGVYINEVSAVGEDWIELYNGSEDPVDLNGWVIADKRNGEGGLVLSGTLGPHAYALYETLPFGIDASGEKLYLFDAEGQQVDSFKTGSLKEGLTCGRENGQRVFYDVPTPGAMNGPGYAGYADTPLIEDRALYRTEPFLLRIYGEGNELRYTLDGSVPTQNSELYTQPPEIAKSAVVRVRAFREGFLPSETVTVTYLFTEKHTVPVVTLAMDPAKWEKLRVAKYEPLEAEADVGYYEADGSFGVSFPAGITIRGNASRKNAHKSFGIHLRARYGQKEVTYPFWGEGTALPYANLTLRSGSQDMLKARMRDSFCIRASAGLHVDTMQTRLAVVYVNGEYYGLADLNEGMNQDYVETHYGIDGESVNIVEWNDTVTHGSGAGMRELHAFVRTHDLKDDENYRIFCTMVDIDAFTDYLIAETFFCNGDYHNLMYWGTDDGRFPYRPVLYDMDNILLEDNSHYNNMGRFFAQKGFRYGPNNKYYVDTTLFAALKRNPAWRQKFVERYAYLLCHDYSVETLETLIDRMVGEMAPEMPRNIEKWGAPKSIAYWQKQTDILKKQIRLRHEKIQVILRGEFNVSKKDWAGLMEKYGGEA